MSALWICIGLWLLLQVPLALLLGRFMSLQYEPNGQNAKENNERTSI